MPRKLTETAVRAHRAAERAANAALADDAAARSRAEVDRENMARDLALDAFGDAADDLTCDTTDGATVLFDPDDADGLGLALVYPDPRGGDRGALYLAVLEGDRWHVQATERADSIEAFGRAIDTWRAARDAPVPGAEVEG